MWVELLIAFQVKHLLLDFIYQPPYMWKNKGTYGHPGGIIHSGIHALASLFILWLFGVVPWLIAAMVLLEFIIHYHMDWFKMWYGKLRGYAANTHEQFWWWMGIDQFVHQMTYIAMAIIAGYGIAQ